MYNKGKYTKEVYTKEKRIKKVFKNVDYVAIYEAIKEMGPTNRAVIGRKLNIDYMEIRAKTDQLEKLGLIKRVGPSLFVVTEDGSHE